VGDDGRGPPVSRAGWLCWARPRRSACGWAVPEWSAGVGVKLGRAVSWVSAGPRQSAVPGRGGSWAAGDASAGGVLHAGRALVLGR
jgi:hypothetical protein